MMKYRLLALLLIVTGLLIGYFVYVSETETESGLFRPFRLGLDLSGGAHLVYRAETDQLEGVEVREVMSSLREVIERRVNVFGVSEPLVQAEQRGFGAEAEHRLIVELPGVADIDEALRLIDETPILEFKLLNPEADLDAVVLEDGTVTLENLDLDSLYVSTGLDGSLVRRAQVVFGSSAQGGLSLPEVLVEFNQEGATLLRELTRDNVGEVLAIFLDGELKSSPVIRSVISDGQAVISGNFTIEEARTLVRDLNLGALPVPITLISTQTIGASLGDQVLDQGIYAGIIGLIIVSLFMVFWYRLPGLVAVLALSFYVVLMLTIFKLIPVTLTAAGIAGFILSIGIAVDANVLIFERIKEELRSGKKIRESIEDGFARAWPSIRDSNFSSIISAAILFWFGTSLIKGFALTFGLGVLFSMFTAIVITRTWLLALGAEHKKPWIVFLFGSGLNK